MITLDISDGTEYAIKFLVLKCKMEKDFDVLIRKRKSRNFCHSENTSMQCVQSTTTHHPSSSSSSRTSIMDEKIGNNKKCKITSFTRCKNPHYYFTHVILLSLLFQLLLITQGIQCMDVNEHGSSINSVNSDNYKLDIFRMLNSDYTNHNITLNNITMSGVSNKLGIRSHRHRRNQHRRRSHYDPNVQAIQPKICHSLASSSSYLSSAFAHNFPLSSSSKSSSPSYNELSIENKLVLSPIVFQGLFLHCILVFLILNFFC